MLLSGCGGQTEAGERLVIACGDDTAGILIKRVVERNPDLMEEEVSAEQVGDCCGSNAQFALSTGEVDIAVVCPDAIRFLPDDGKDYEVVGAVVLDSNLLVRRTASVETPASVGYMNNRQNQIDLLRQRFGEKAELKQMYASGLTYALENEAVDAVVLDAMTALAAGLPFEPLSENDPSSVLVIRRELLADGRFLDFTRVYNEEIDRLSSDREELLALLQGYLQEDGIENSEEVLSTWQEMNVKFQKLGTEARDTSS